MPAPRTRTGDPGEEFVENLRSCADLTGNVTLKGLVAQCDAASLLKQFLAADHDANGLQRRHRTTVHGTVWPGTVALVLGIVQLPFHDKAWAEYGITLWFELLLIGSSAVAVGLGIHYRWHKRWLLRRYQAERFRLLVFDLAIDPELWTGKQPRGGDWKHWIKPLADSIDNLTTETFESEAHREELPNVPSPSACHGVARGALKDLIGFYSGAWLDSQVEYFGKKVRDAERRAWIRPGMVSMVFAISVGVVFIHLALAFSHNKTGSLVFLMAAALLPAMFAAVRTWRSALEISRNAARAGAKRRTLIDLQEVLYKEDHEEKPEKTDAVWFYFKTLALAQALLQSEQREWLRLMLEAEWIG